MRIALRILLPVLLVSTLTLSSCSTTENEESFQAQAPTRPNSGQVKLDTEDETSALAAENKGVSQADKAKQTTPESTAPQTKMYLEAGVDRIWQNGPSPEERYSVNKLTPRKPRKGVEDGFSSPVLDTTGLVLINE